MVIKADFETQDMDGSTSHFSGTVGTTAIAVPTIADKQIAEIYVENDADNTPLTKTLLFSCDGGVNFTKLRVGDSMIWTPKGRIQQIYIKGGTAGVAYQMIVNFEDI